MQTTWRVAAEEASLTRHPPARLRHPHPDGTLASDEELPDEMVIDKRHIRLVVAY